MTNDAEIKSLELARDALNGMEAGSASRDLMIWGILSHITAEEPAPSQDELLDRFRRARSLPGANPPACLTTNLAEAIRYLEAATPDIDWTIKREDGQPGAKASGSHGDYLLHSSSRRGKAMHSSDLALHVARVAVDIRLTVARLNLEKEITDAAATLAPHS